MEIAIVAFILGIIAGMICFEDDYSQMPGLLSVIIWGVVPCIGFSLGLVIRKAIKKLSENNDIGFDSRR